MTLVAIPAEYLGITDTLVSFFSRRTTFFVDARLGMALSLGDM